MNRRIAELIASVLPADWQVFVDARGVIGGVNLLTCRYFGINVRLVIPEVLNQDLEGAIEYYTTDASQSYCPSSKVEEMLVKNLWWGE